LGILSRDNAQLAFLDTPGISKKNNKLINRHMNRTASHVLKDVDVVLLVTDKFDWDNETIQIFDKIKRTNKVFVWIINKVDKIKKKENLLPFIESVSNTYKFAEVFPVSAFTKHNLDSLINFLCSNVPTGPFHFASEQVTDCSKNFLVIELIREQIVRQLGDEIPYETLVEIDNFSEKSTITEIFANIVVQKKSQKGIVVGTNGDRLKKIGIASRRSLENLLKTQVSLKLWVKVVAAWSQDERVLISNGIAQSEFSFD